MRFKGLTSEIKKKPDFNPVNFSGEILMKKVIF
jgi:hypothetical protein